VTTLIEPSAKPGSDPLVRVVKGELADEELAALTAVLVARAAAESKSGHFGDIRSQARWQRPERRPSYNSPVSWHS
jgi:hypothetical protein